MTQANGPDDFSVGNIDSLASRFGANLENGLTADVARQRFAQDGPNQLLATPRISTWRRILSQFQDPLIYLLLGAITISLAAWVFEGLEGWPIDAIVIALIVLLNGVIGHVQAMKAHDAVAALSKMSAPTASVVRNGQTQRVPSVDLVKGDLLDLAEGDAIAADARLVGASTLRIQESSLTGESEAVLKDPAPLSGPAALGDQLNMVFKGTFVAQGTGRALVVATGMLTQMGSIAGMLAATKQQPTPLEKEISHIGRMLSIAVLVIAIVVVGAVLVISRPDSIAEVIGVLLLGVALAVAAVPEGLPTILSVVLALGVQRMARHNAIVKNLSSVETLGATSVICSDKTGTLTRSEMTIVRMMTASGETSVTGVGYVPEGQVELKGESLLSGLVHAEQVVLLSGGSLASNASLRQLQDGSWEVHGDPTEAAFLVAERKLGVTARREQRFERIREIPFTSERKIMSTIELDHEHDNERVLISKGAPDVLLGRCTRVRVGMDVVPLDEDMHTKILANVDTLSGEALRTLAVAYRPLAANEDLESLESIESLERNLIFVGTAGIIDPPREEAAVAIREARRAGIRVLMITGDHPRTAASIAADLGLVEAGEVALTGADLDQLDEAAFAEAVRQTSVYARVAPAHKLRIVGALQADGNIVAMTGDGVNDAPALKAANIGVAMGVTGTEVAKGAARMILADDNFATIVHAVREGRGIFDNIRKFLRYLLSSNIGEVLTVFFGVVLAGAIGLTAPDGTLILPLLATQILWLNLITDSWPALAMGLDPSDDDVMARKPRPPSERVIDAAMWWGVVQIGLVVSVVTLLTIDIYLPGGMVEGDHDLANARTAGFTVLVFAHLFNCFNARSETASAFSHPVINLWLWGAVTFSALLQVAVVHIEILNTAFGTVPLMLSQWFFCAAMGSAVLWYSELRKFVKRRIA